MAHDARSLVVFGARGADPRASAWPTVTVDAAPVRCGLVPAAEPRFDPGDPANARRVLVRVRAVSCNYRDRSFISLMARVPAARYSAVGSDFVADVVAAGPAVTTLAAGDRVVPDHHFTGAGDERDGVREGVATNQASRAYHVLDERKLVRVPAGMRDEAAAAVGIGAQTAYGIARRLAPEPGARVLVTSASSNTALFVLGALARRGVRAVAATSSARFADRLRSLGAESVVPTGREAIVAAARRVGGFDFVVDPFFDLHLMAAVEALRPFGTYVTCGLAGQTEHAARAAGAAGPLDVRDVMAYAMTKNLTLVGNCLGLTADLERALADHAAGALPVTVDSVFERDADAAAFLDRTFNSRERFGKVVFRYAA